MTTVEMKARVLVRCGKRRSGWEATGKEWRIKRSMAAVVAVLGAASAAGTASASSMTDWTEYSSNPVYAPGKAYYPTIVRNAGLFYMWSDCADGVQMATSSDGINWTTIGLVSGLLNPRHTVVEKIGAEYRMWYNDTSKLYTIEAIRTATSSDGLVWTGDQSITQVGATVVTGVWPAWNTGSYGPCDILYNPAGSETLVAPVDKASVWANKYVMYYDGTTGADEFLGLAVSSNGLHWQGYGDGAGPVLDSTESAWDSGYVAFGTVIKESDDSFHLWYSGGSDSTLNNGIGYASSTDGINWVKDPDNPIFHKNDGVGWRDDRTYTPMVIGTQMWFSGRDKDGTKAYAIGYAVRDNPPLASLGDYVWNDANANGVQDAGELPIPDVPVTLYDGTGGVVATTSTDGAGSYLFASLMPGVYSVGFTAPVGHVFSPQDQGGDDAKDSDPNPADGRTAATTLVSGENDLSWDAGMLSVRSRLDVEKATNGEDADSPTGPLVLVGDPVIWTYRVTNTGNVPLIGVSIVDDNGTPANPGDDVSVVSGLILAVGASRTFTRTGVGVAGQYGNLATARGTSEPTGAQVRDSDPSHYFGAIEGLTIQKLTNGEDVAGPPGPTIPVGASVTWTYRVTNTGNVPLTAVTVTDDQGVIPVHVSGDDGNGVLEPGATWIYKATGVAAEGAYRNIATARGTSPRSHQLTARDTSWYTGASYDLGDAPDPTYPTLLASNGARHRIVRTLCLGSIEDSEPDGQPSIDAIGDDLAQSGDEDGVDPLQPILAQGVGPAIVVRLHNATGLPATVTGWIDFDRDGLWEVGERAAATAAPGAASVVLRFPTVSGNGSAGCLDDQALYVLDGGRRLLRYDLGSGGVSVCATGFSGAFDLAADELGNIYVADFGGAAIYAIPGGCGPKTALTKWTRGGPATPWALAYHGGYLYVSDRSANRILEIDPVTGQRATYVSGVVDPVALNFDQDGNLYVATHHGAFLAKYDPAGVLISDKWVDPSLGYVDISDVLVERGGYQTYARFRISTDAASVGVPTGASPDGEVEDYVVTVLPTNFLVLFSGNDANIVYACGAAGESAEVADFWSDRIQNPFGLAQDCRGRLFVASSGSAAIYVIDPQTGLSSLWDDSHGNLLPMAGPYGLLIVDEP